MTATPLQKNLLLHLALEWMLRPVNFSSEEKRTRVLGLLVEAMQNPEMIAKARTRVGAAFRHWDGPLLAFHFADVFLLLTLLPDALPTRDIPQLDELAHRAAVVELTDRMVAVMTKPGSTDCKILAHLACLTT